MMSNSTVGWMPEPQGRGTIGLVWSCLATIFICNWSALHLNVPAQGTGLGSRTRIQALYVTAGLFAPEWLTYLALCDLERTLMIKRRCSTWSLKRCFFLNMGGFMILQNRKGPRTASSQYLLELFEKGTLPWPQFDDSDIDNRTQGDALVKLIALSQLIWFATQIIGRAIDGSAVTTLELFTLSNVLCSVVTYNVWWEKPYNVRCPILLETGIACLDSFESSPDWDLSGSIEKPGTKITIASICVGLSFGALHLLGWRFYFPSLIECLLWRICSVGVTILSATLPLSRYVFTVCNAEPKSRFVRRMNGILDFKIFGRRTVADVVLYAPSAFYMMFRFYMVVEMFVGLGDVPTSVYKTTQWSQYFPALG